MILYVKLNREVLSDIKMLMLPKKVFVLSSLCLLLALITVIFYGFSTSTIVLIVASVMVFALSFLTPSIAINNMLKSISEMNNGGELNLMLKLNEDYASLCDTKGREYEKIKYEHFNRIVKKEKYIVLFTKYGTVLPMLRNGINEKELVNFLKDKPVKINFRG